MRGERIRRCPRLGFLNGSPGGGCQLPGVARDSTPGFHRRPRWGRGVLWSWPRLTQAAALLVSVGGGDGRG